MNGDDVYGAVGWIVMMWWMYDVFGVFCGYVDYQIIEESDMGITIHP